MVHSKLVRFSCSCCCASGSSPGAVVTLGSTGGRSEDLGEQQRVGAQPIPDRTFREGRGGLGRARRAVADRRWQGLRRVPGRWQLVGRQPIAIVDMKAAFPDWHVTIEKLVAEGDLVVNLVRISATHSGFVNGIAPSGRRIETLAMHMWHVTDEKLVEGWYATDALPHVVSAVLPIATTFG